MTRAEALRILDLDDRGTPDEVRATYRELVKMWHPDRFANDPGLRAKADRRLQEINCAYAALRGRAETVEPRWRPAPRPYAPPRYEPPRRAPVHSPDGWTRRPTDEPPTRPTDEPPTRQTDQSTPARWSVALLVIVGLFTGAAVVSIGLMFVRPEQAPAPRPISGTDLLATPAAGDRSLIVSNADARDAVLVFVDAGVQTRAVYIRAGEQLQMLDVEPGAHRIWVASGRDWNRDHFATAPVFQEIGEPLTFVNDASTPQTITIAGPETGSRTRLRARSPFPLSVRR